MNLNDIKEIVAGNPTTFISEDRKIKAEEKSPDSVKILWDYAYRSGNDAKVAVQCKLDGDIQFRCISDLMKGSYRCRVCLSSKYKTIAINAGFEFIAFVPDSKASFIIIRCPKDGNMIKVRTANLLNQKNLHCSQCRLNACIANLHKFNCKYVNSYHDHRHVLYVEYMDTEGNKRSASEPAIVKGNFAKSKSHWQQKHFLYLITNKTGNGLFYKIGTANNPDNRLSDLKLIGLSTVQILGVFSSRHEADLVEKKLHVQFSAFNLNKEIPTLFTAGMSKIGKPMGITEWFSDAIYPEIKEMYNLD